MRWIAMLLLAAPAWACSCAWWPSPREAFDDSRLVFVGSVGRTYMTAAGGSPSGTLQQIAEVRVEEAFKGIRSEQEIVLHQPVNSCSPNYREGDRVLYYLHPTNDGAWVALGCHRSRPLATAADDLLFLRALPESLARSRVSGEVELYENSPSEGFHRVRALPGIRVTISGQNLVKEAFTNADGVYEVYGLPPGKYRVDMEVPSRMKMSFPVPFGRSSTRRLQSEIDLPPNGGAGVGFVLKIDSQISGRILDPAGKPMNDVCVHLEPASMPSGTFHVLGCSKNAGQFLLDEVPPGQYRLVVNPSGLLTSREPFSTLYYPGTSAKEAATVVTIAAGEHIEALDIKIPNVARRIQIAGHMQFADGTPVHKSWVKFASVDGNHEEQAETQADGSFELTILAGRPGELVGEIWVDQEAAASCPNFRATFKPGAFLVTLRTPTLFVGAASDQSGLLLTLPFPLCKAWRN